MIKAQTDFKERVIEIEAYFAFVQQIHTGEILLSRHDHFVSAGSLGVQRHIPAYTSLNQKNLIRTFQASAFLLLYNLMESTVNNAIEAIFDEFSDKGVSFDSCRKTIRKVVLSNLKQHELDKILPELNCLSIDIVTKTFKKNEIVSGNVDDRKIRRIADEYGFARPYADGSHLHTVKTSRNDLAHGSKSFAEIGKDYSVNDVILKKDKVIKYLEVMLENVATYIKEEHYLTTHERP